MLLALLLSALLWLPAVARGPQPPRASAPAVRPAGDAAAQVSYPPDAIPLAVGIHVKNLYNLQLESQTFSADGWYWLEWDQRLEARMREAGIRPQQLVEFNNQVETWDSDIEPESPEPLREGDSFYQVFRFSARFYIDSLDVHNSPFDTIVLPLVIETRPEPFSLEQQAVRLVPARSQFQLVGEYADLAGYELRGARIEQGINTYAPLGTGAPRAYSQVAVRVQYGSDFQAAFLKWILPLLIVMVVVLLAPSLESSLGDIRLAIPSTALLTLVFLQQTYRAELPATPYPTFLDQLYAYCYLVAVGLFILFVWSSNQFESTPEERRPAVRRRINRIDLLCQGGALVGLLIWGVWSWFF